MNTELKCKRCSKHMGILRDAKIRNGMAVYCAECDDVIQRILDKKDRDAHLMPDFMRDFFK